MAHISIRGVPTELHQAAIDALGRLIGGTEHTGEVLNPEGTRVFGTDPAPAAPETPSEPAG